MKPQRQETVSLTDEAARWLIELEEDAAAHKVRAQCLAWLKESPAHVKEFLRVLALWKGLDNPESHRHANVEQLLAQASADVVPLSDTAQFRPDTPRQRSLQKFVGLAAAITVIAVGVWWALPHVTNTQTYTTAVGEQRAIKLSDGSLINLNTDSRIEVRLGKDSREIYLLAGEALFTVARDAQRPFRVHATDMVIQAVGTQFNVYRRAGGTTVSVLEGMVQVSKPVETSVPSSPPMALLAAGEEASITPSGRVTKESRADVSKAIAWRDRRLVFRGDTLAAVVAEVNRYNEDLQLQVVGAARERKLIGVFAADDPESLIQFLARDGELAVERNAADITIRAR